ncbi:MAG: bifunctional diaminohydroxyphosphoribosylaminopyrimidine deaminase/5-amino-6-(5-phosphoribosylamino)uracil reductase RibD [Verrucomicrobiales bacterium]
MTPAPAEDHRFMAMALREARKGVGLTSPNPPVGALVVSAAGEILGKGWHRRAGGPHAEVVAIRAAGGSAACRGATLYVTLEPCSTHGRTPPCVEAVIEAGISRVVWAVDDPNPSHAGRARNELAAHGIQVASGVLADQAAALLAPWRKFITTGRPWVIAKAGISLDGKLTRPRGEGQWITSERAREDACRLRWRVDAIMVGAETVRKDNPSLTLRVPRPGKLQPWRVVLTKSGRLPADARLFTDDHRDRTLVVGHQPLAETLVDLAARDVVTVLIEGGGALLAQAFSQQLVDEAVFYLAPLLCGTGRPVIDPAWFAGGSVQFTHVHWKTIGDNCRVSGLVARADGA